DKSRQPGENGVSVLHQFEEAPPLESQQLLDGLRRLMFSAEIPPEFQLRASHITREIQAVLPSVAELIHHGVKGAFVEWLAVHDHPVHIENHRAKAAHFAAESDLWTIWQSNMRSVFTK